MRWRSGLRLSCRRRLERTQIELRLAGALAGGLRPAHGRLTRRWATVAVAASAAALIAGWVAIALRLAHRRTIAASRAGAGLGRILRRSVIAFATGAPAAATSTAA